MCDICNRPDMAYGMTKYQRAARKFALYPNLGRNAEYPVLGLTGEAGEIANKVKKLQRDNLSRESMRDDIAAELGDVLWYLAAVADEFDLDLGNIAVDNLEKLTDRKMRDMISGSGDNR